MRPRKANRTRKVIPGWFWVIGALVVIAAAVLLRMWHYRERQLMECASRVNVPPGTGLIGWFSDRDVLTQRYVHGSLHYFRRDAKTGTEQALPLFDRLLRPTHSAELLISPDGRWVLWNDGSNQDRTFVLSSDGKHYSGHIADRWEFRWCWTADSRRWVEFATKPVRLASGPYGTFTKAFARDVDSPQEFITLYIPITYQTYGGILTAAGDLLVGPHIYPCQMPLVITEYRLMPNLGPLRKWSISLPFAGQVDEYRISPTGDEIAWKVITQRSNPWFDWLHRMLPFVKDTIRQREEVWVSRIDGSNWHELGYIPGPAIEENDKGTYLSLNWLPDGKGLDFVYKDTLHSWAYYTVDVNND